MIEGVLAASVTPLTKELGIDGRRFEQHCRWLLENGCDALALFGTTGEANSFPVKERIAALEYLAKSQFDLTKVIVGTGCCAIEDTVELTRHALRCGVSGVLMLPPFYYKKISDEGLLAYFAQVIEKTASDRLKIYLYNFPLMTGISFSFELIGMLRKNFSGVVAGIKDSSGNYENMKQMSALFPGFQVFSGTERYLQGILESGGAGCISASVNVTAGLASRIYHGWKNAEDISLMQNKLSEIRTFLEKFPMIAAIKTILSVWHSDDNLSLIKPPHIPLAKSEAAMLIKSKYIEQLLAGETTHGEKSSRHE
jgi:4-hydroxy-tetrahydrodipicolinate synthase